MEDDIIKAKEKLKSEKLSCVLCKNDIFYTSDKKGIIPIIEFIDMNINMNGFSVADKIVGKAAALLFVLLDVSCVFSEVMSKGAINVFKKNKIQYSYETCVENIINREGTGLCPMETAVFNIETPNEALKAVKIKLIELRSSKH